MDRVGKDKGERRQVGNDRRVRQKIQNEDKLFLPTDPVIRARREKQRRMREVIKEV